MKNDGKGLEAFVRSVEEVLAGTTMKLIQNRRVYSDDGIQLAELDLEIEGVINGRQFRSLIECRDRPSQGKAPASWIQQMAGRRLQFGFDNVIAVSSMGFSDAAVKAANIMDVELRQISVLSPVQSLNWIIPPERNSHVEITCHPIQGFIGLRGPIFSSFHTHVQNAIRHGIKNNTPFIRTKLDGLVSIDTVWQVIWHHEHAEIGRLPSNTNFRTITIYRKPVGEGSLWVETENVCVPVEFVSFQIQLFSKKSNLVPSSLEAYHKVGGFKNLSESLILTPTSSDDNVQVVFQKVDLAEGGFKYRVGIRQPHNWRPPFD